MAERMQERGLSIDRSCLGRWVQDDAPEINRRCRPHGKPTGKGWRVDGTYVKVKGQDHYLYRVGDSAAQTIAFLLTEKRDAAAARRFLRKALSAVAAPAQCVIHVDRNPANPLAIERLNAEGSLRRCCRLRRCKFLNHLVEPDHRIWKQRVWLAKEYGSFRSAWRTLQSIEAVNMIRKGRASRVAKGDTVAPTRFVSRMFDVAAYNLV